ncbi:MAG: YdcF family protein [Myxococcales bacterium]|nr:YdcF family protein [Myxococcales bacterium]
MLRLRTLVKIVMGVSLVGTLGIATTNLIVIRTGVPIYEQADQLPNKTVILVPGARVYQDGTPYPALEDRLVAALEAWKLGKATRILVSGDHQYNGYDEVNGMRTWLLEAGVPSEVIFMDHAGLRTLDTMARAAQVFGVKDAILCTQRFHLSRSLFLAHQAGIDAVGLTADRRIYPKAPLDAVREAIARTVAILDTTVFHTQPKFAGPPISLEGDAAQTHDRWTQRTD